MTWAMPPVARDQWVLFESMLEEVIPEDHLVRVLDEIVRSLDGGPFEAKSHGTLGARPVPPRVLASVILVRASDAGAVEPAVGSGVVVSRRLPLAGRRVAVGSRDALDVSQRVRRLAPGDQHAVRLAGASDGGHHADAVGV